MPSPSSALLRSGPRTLVGGTSPPRNRTPPPLLSVRGFPGPASSANATWCQFPSELVTPSTKDDSEYA
eukprot:2346619-Lingulodinium_polyedra.AAC.1